MFAFRMKIFSNFYYKTPRRLFFLNLKVLFWNGTMNICTNIFCQCIHYVLVSYIIRVFVIRVWFNRYSYGAHVLKCVSNIIYFWSYVHMYLYVYVILFGILLSVSGSTLEHHIVHHLCSSFTSMYVLETKKKLNVPMMD